MHTTADATDLFRQIDGTDIDSHSYTFNVAEDVGEAAAVPEGEEFPRKEVEHTQREVSFVDYAEIDRQHLAQTTLVDVANVELAGAKLPDGFEYTTLYIDRATGDSYLVDTRRFGYEVVKEETDDGEPIRGAFVGILPDAALRVK